MTVRVRQMISIRQFSSGRRTMVLNRVRAVAERRGLAQIVAYIDRALAHELETRAMENRWSSRDRGRQHPERLPEIDSQLDQVLVGIRDIAEGHARGLAADHPTAVQVAKLMGTIFPHGVLAVTALPYVDQVLAVEAIARELQNGLAATATALGLDARVALLVELTAEYRRLIDAGRGNVEYSTLRAARERGQLYLRELIAMVIGTFHDGDAAGHAAAREELLAPIAEQLDRLQARARARRRNAPAEAAGDGDSGEAGDGGEDGDGDGEAGDGDGEAGEVEAGADEELVLAGVLAEERAADLTDGVEVPDDRA